MKSLLRLAYRLLRVSWFVRRPITLGVRVLLIRDNHILLVRHTYQDAWYFPGGGVKKGETLERAIRREASEEAGAKLENLALFGVYTSFTEYKNDHIVVFACDAFSVTGESDREIEYVQFFPLDRLPADLAPGCLRRVQEYVAGKWSNYGTW
jgi:8-oxo-dGTP pyrophosphatase MutT (NUDIX family)